jgi:hypothetical protein
MKITLTPDDLALFSRPIEDFTISIEPTTTVTAVLATRRAPRTIRPNHIGTFG